MIARMIVAALRIAALACNSRKSIGTLTMVIDVVGQCSDIMHRQGLAVIADWVIRKVGCTVDTRRAILAGQRTMRRLRLSHNASQIDRK